MSHPQFISTFPLSSAVHFENHQINTTKGRQKMIQEANSEVSHDERLRSWEQDNPQENLFLVPAKTLMCEPNSHFYYPYQVIFTTVKFQNKTCQGIIYFLGSSVYHSAYNILKSNSRVYFKPCFVFLLFKDGAPTVAQASLGHTMYRSALKSQYNHLSLLSAGITRMSHHDLFSPQNCPPYKKFQNRLQKYSHMIDIRKITKASLVAQVCNPSYSGV